MKRIFPFLLLIALFLCALCACSPRNKDVVYRVNFVTDGTRLDAVDADYLEKTPITTKTGYAFEGWYTDFQKNDRVFFPYRVSKDVTLYAKFIDLAVGNEENEYTACEGGYMLSAYTGESESLVVPALYQGQPVVGLDASGILYASYLTTVYFHQLNVVNGYLYLFPKLQKFVQTGEGGYYIVKDGVLFSQEGDALFCYPRSKNDLSYTLPNGTKTIEKHAFTYADKLLEIRLNDEISEIKENFCLTRSLRLFYIENNDVFSTEQGALYEGSTLRCLPDQWTGETFTVKTGTAEISDDALTGASVKTLVLPDTVTSFGIQREMDSLTDFVVEDSPYFYVKDGVLYSVDRHLIRYPAKKEGESFSAEAGTVAVDAYAFVNCDCLKDVTFPSSVVSVSKYAFTGCKVERIVFSTGSALTYFDEGAVAENTVAFSVTFSTGYPPTTRFSEFPDKLSRIYAPKNVAALYRATWRAISNKIEESTAVLPEYDARFVGGVDDLVYTCACIVTAPTVKKDGFMFNGWYLDESFIEEAVFPVLLTEDVVYYARWIPLE